MRHAGIRARAAAEMAAAGADLTIDRQADPPAALTEIESPLARLERPGGDRTRYDATQR